MPWLEELKKLKAQRDALRANASKLSASELIMRRQKLNDDMSRIILLHIDAMITAGEAYYTGVH